MKIIRLNDNDIQNFSQYEIHKSIKNQEANLYIYKKDYLLKLFKSTDNNILDNKMYILNKLFYIRNYIDIKEIVWPNDLVKIGDVSRGFTMDFIKNNTNISLIFNSNKIPSSTKLYYLKLIGKILEKIENDKELNKIGFHLSDIHEGNFILDNINNVVRAIDIDSSSVLGSNASKSKFLFKNDKLWDFKSKYPLDDNNYHIPNKNTTIISFVYMLLNLITGYYTPDLSIHDFVLTLNILSTVGVNKELLDSIFNIYSKNDNYFDYDLVSSIKPKMIEDYKELRLKI